MKIEIYESKVSPTKERSAAFADPSAAAAPARAAEGIGQTLSDIGDRMTRAQAFQERTNAVNKTRESLGEIIMRAQSDPDPKNAQRYIDEIGKVRERVQKEISLGSARREFEADFGSLSNAALMDIKQDQRKKIVNLGLASIDQGLRQLSQVYVSQADPRKQRQTIEQMNLLIEEGVLNGFIAPDKAQEMKDKNLREIGIDKFYSDLSSVKTPEAVGEMLDALREGGYEQNGVTIDPEKKKTMYEQGEKYIAKFEKEAKAAKEASYDLNNRQAMLDMFEGKLTLSELQRRFLNDEIKESDYNTLEAKLVKPDYEALRQIRFSDAEAFNEIRQAQLTGSKTPGEIDRLVAAHNAAGKINDQDAKYLFSINEKMAPDPRDAAVNAAAQSVRDWADRYVKGGPWDAVMGGKEKKQKIENVVTEFLKRVDEAQAKDADIQIIMRNVIGDTLKREHPELNRMEDIPHVVIDINGKVQRMLTPTEKTALKPKFRISRVDQAAPEKKEKAEK